MAKIVIIILVVIGIPIWIFIKISDYFSDQKQDKERKQRKENEIKQKFGDRQINKNLSLEERNEDIIQLHIKNISAGYHRNYYIENMVRDCIDDIANAERSFDIAPGYKYLSDWTRSANTEYLSLMNSLLKRFNSRHKNLNDIENEKKQNDTKIKLDNLRRKNNDLIIQFFDVTERKVSIIDDYGDENWEELPKQINILISKIAKKEGHTDEEIKDWGKYIYSIPDGFKLLREKLESEFKKYHMNQKSKTLGFDADTIGKMSGVDFEVFLSKKLRELGYETTGTSTTGDQGADLIVKKNGRKIIIQAKRYSGSVGNKAVQEVVGAINYYQGDEGCVITNSTFTPSAKALAQKNNIKLIDGYDLKNIEKYF